MKIRWTKMSIENCVRKNYPQNYPAIWKEKDQDSWNEFFWMFAFIFCGSKKNTEFQILYYTQAPTKISIYFSSNLFNLFSNFLVKIQEQFFSEIWRRKNALIHTHKVHWKELNVKTNRQILTIDLPESGLLKSKKKLSATSLWWMDFCALHALFYCLNVTMWDDVKKIATEEYHSLDIWVNRDTKSRLHTLDMYTRRWQAISITKTQLYYVCYLNERASEKRTHIFFIYWSC